MKLLVDIGGSGVKIAKYKDKTIGKVGKYGAASSVEELIRMIRNAAGDERATGISISTAGFVNSDEGRILHCKCAPGLEGEIVKKLKKEFPLTKIAIINDGEAHARALLNPARNIRFGAVHLAFGTSVSLGVINDKKQVIHACSGENWDIGDFELRTKEEPYEVWYKLGSKGLSDLEKNTDISNPYYHYGCRMGSFLRNLAVIFRPRTIGLSGGIVSSHESDILRGVNEEFRKPVYSDKVDIVVLRGENSAMEGLTTL